MAFYVTVIEEECAGTNFQSVTPEMSFEGDVMYKNDMEKETMAIPDVDYTNNDDPSGNKCGYSFLYEIA